MQQQIASTVKNKTNKQKNLASPLLSHRSEEDILVPDLELALIGSKL